MNRRRIAFASLLLVACLFPVAPARAETDPPQGLFEDEWFTVTMGDKRCGYMHATTARRGDDILSEMAMSFTFTRGNVKIAMGITPRYNESLKGAPKSFEHTMKMGTEPTTTRGEFSGGKVKLATEQFGAKHESEYPIDHDIKFPWGQLLEQRKRGLAKGTEYVIKTYDPSVKVDGAIETTIAIGDKEDKDVLGKRRKLTKVVTTVQAPSLPQPIVADSWVDDEARPVITSVDVGVFELHMYESTKEEALRDVEPAEMFLNTFVKADKKIDARDQKLTLRLKLPASGERHKRLPDLPETDMQKFRRVNDHEAVVTIARSDWEALRKAPADGKAMTDYLRAAPFVDINDARIKRLARKAAGEAQTPAEKADALRKYVTDYVKHKGFDTGFATAQEVVRERRGDCSEHSVLLAALARACGLPARGVSGLVLIPDGHWSAGGQESQFGYHMWTQVYIGGRWVDIDAAMRQTECDPTHIALAIMSLNDENIAQSAIALLPLLGRLEIEVLARE